ncbi:hypothetical protein HDU99_001036 [Rhizoclosmatium hyalinum]|nr:hypothetical protein HDU99_001036 [Rhizoclosmatium hyalinum]
MPNLPCNGEQNNITYSDVTIRWFNDEKKQLGEHWRISGSAQNGLECKLSAKIPTVSITRRVTQPNGDSALTQELYAYENAAKPLKMQNSKVVSAGTTTLDSPLPSLSVKSSLSPSIGYHPSYLLSFSLPEAGSLSAKLDAIVIHLPINHHAFADPFQIDGLNKLNNDIEFVAYGEPDLEVSIEESEKARMNGVFVVIKEVGKFMNQRSPSIEIPLHMRYQPPSQEGGYVTVPVLPATVYAVVPKDSEFLHSSAINPVISHLLKGSLRDSSKFVGLRQQSFVELPVESVESFSMKMPVGNSEDARWVLWTLSSVVIASCIYVMMAFVGKFKHDMTPDHQTPITTSTRHPIPLTSPKPVEESIRGVVVILDRLDGGY